MIGARGGTAPGLGPLDLLRRLIESSGYSGDPRILATAAPHMASTFEPADYVRTLRNLGLPFDIAETSLDRIRPGDCPCLILPETGPPSVALERSGAGALLLRSGDGAETWRDIDGKRGAVLKLRDLTTSAHPTEDASPDPIRAMDSRFRAATASLLFASLISNLFAFATPVLIMALYDRVIPADAADMIPTLCVAAAMIFTADFALRTVRARAVSEIGAAIERDLGAALFRKLSALPLPQIEISGVERQIARLRQFEGMRDLFTGPVLASALDLPFMFLFLAAVFWLSPLVGFMLIFVVALYAIAAAIALPQLRSKSAAAAASRTAAQKLLYEIATQRAEIQRLGAVDWWTGRFAGAIGIAAQDARRLKTAQLVATTVGQSLMAIAGACTVAIGARAALAEEISFGALIALMAIVWRVLGPLQALYANAQKIESLLSTRGQVARLMTMEEEFSRGARVSRMKAFQGAIEFIGVNHRFRAGDEPALSNLSFSIPPGEIVMVCGDSGAGKSTLLNMIANIYSPGVGRLRMDGVDYRQIAVDDLRNSIGYARQNAEFFYGTVAQNMRLAHPMATDRDIDAALEALGIADEIRSWPDGTGTRMSEAFQARMSPSFSKALSLARAILSDAPVLLLDEPLRGLHQDRGARFLKILEEMRGSKTIVLVTEDINLLKRADRILFLDGGRLIVNDHGRSAIKKVESLFSQTGGG